MAGEGSNAGGALPSPEDDLDERLRRLVDAAIATTAAERGFLLLLREEGELHMRTARDLRGDLGSSPRISRSVTERVLRDNRSLLALVSLDVEGGISNEVPAPLSR